MILGLVCARAGSKGLVRKNVRSLVGKPLVLWAVEKAAQARGIYSVAVSTDCPEVGRILGLSSYAYSVTMIHRPDNLATDEASKWVVWKHALRDMEQRTGVKYEAVVDIDVTRPLTTVDDVDRVVRAWHGQDGVVAIAPGKVSPYFDVLERDRSGWVYPSKMSIGSEVTTRQTAPPGYVHGGIYLFSRDYLFSSRYLWDGKVQGVAIPRIHAFDVDDETDWTILEAIARTRIPQYMDPYAA